MDADTRPLTDAERRTLEGWLKGPRLGSAVGDLLVGSCMASGCLTILVFVLAALVCKLFSLRLPKDAAPALSIFPVVLWMALLLYSVTRRRRPDAPDDVRKLVREALAEGIVRIHRFRATAVVLAYRDQRRERAYFIQLDDGRILFLGKGPTVTPDAKGFPSREFEIAASAGNLLILDVVGRGEYLRPIDEFDLRKEPALSKAPRLVSGRVVDVPWEELRKTFG